MVERPPKAEGGPAGGEGTAQRARVDDELPVMKYLVVHPELDQEARGCGDVADHDDVTSANKLRVSTNVRCPALGTE
jgi:hypothetical protein